MGLQDAESRALFESTSMPLYEEILASGGLVDGDPRVQEGGELHEAFAQLRELGLVRLDPGKATWLVDDPGLAQARVVSPLSQQGAQLLQESSQWA